MNNSGKEVDNTTTTPTPTPLKQKRQYRRITPSVVAKFEALKAIHGNGTQAVRELEPTTADAKRKAWMIATKSNELNASEYVNSKVEQIALEAVERLRELVASPNESIATKNVHYTLDRQGGKAVQRTESKTLVLNIDAILS